MLNLLENATENITVILYITENIKNGCNTSNVIKCGIDAGNYAGVKIFFSGTICPYLCESWHSELDGDKLSVGQNILNKSFGKSKD